MDQRQFNLRDAFASPAPGISYALSESVAQHFRDRYVFETDDPSFDLDTFAARTGAELETLGKPHPQRFTYFRSPEHPLSHTLVQGHRVTYWEGERFDVLTTSWAEPFGEARRTFIAGASRLLVEQFAHRVASVANEVRGEVLVFANGCWNRSKELRDAIRSSTFDNLVLAPGLAETIQDDFRQFLASRAEYEEYGVPWKRGVLFVGPPGNGKTHTVKALLNGLDLPCLYVQSFTARYASAQDNIAQVFTRARRTTPCALVLEDLDALVTDETRSFFLNELDGFASNRGVITIATTNHPERLDPAILDRPSRFDRKYLFEIPAEPERAAYLEHWNRDLKAEARYSADAISDLAQRTDGFSYAYLKELVLSSLTRWISLGRPQPISEVARTQVEGLRAQMTGAADEKRATYVAEAD